MTVEQSVTHMSDGDDEARSVLIDRLMAWDDMITNCAGVPQNPDSLPMMLRAEIRSAISDLTSTPAGDLLRALVASPRKDPTT